MIHLFTTVATTTTITDRKQNLFRKENKKMVIQSVTINKGNSKV